MRILYACHQFFPEYYTGTERYVLDLAKQVRRMGHDVSVLTYATKAFDAQSPKGTGVLRRRYEYEGVPVIALRHVEFDGRGGLPAISFGLEDPLVLQEIQRLFGEQSFNLLHCIHPMRTGEVIRAAKEKGMKVVLHLMDYWMICPRVTLQRADGSLCDGPDQGRNCVTFCYQGNATADWLHKRYADNIHVLGTVDAVLSHSRFLIDFFNQSGVDTQAFIHSPYGFDYAKVQFTKHEWNSGNILNFGFIGTILPHKGVEILIEAFKRVPSDNIRLKIYGGCFEQLEYYSRLRAKAEADKRIQFCGDYEFDLVAQVLHGIDVVVVPSLWYENAPLVISTAQAFGIPVIATRLGGMAEMVLNGVNGFTFNVGDIDDLADKIRLIAQKPDVLKVLTNGKAPPPRIESEAFLLESLYYSLTEHRAASDVHVAIASDRNGLARGAYNLLSMPKTPAVKVVHLREVGELFHHIDKSRINRVIDIGCHRGDHINNVLRVEFPNAEILGVEPKFDNYVECLKLKTEKTNFMQLDCRSLRKETVGSFDLVWCWGLIYHLDDPTLLMKSIQSITHSASLVCIEGHVAIDGEQACLSDPNPPITEQTLDGQTYHGKVYKEFEEGTIQSTKDKMYKASLDNPWAFWLTYDSITRLFANYGFTDIAEFRCSSPTVLLGPGLFYPAVERSREWSRRLFVLSRSEILPPLKKD